MCLATLIVRKLVPSYNYAVEAILDQNSNNCYVKLFFSCKTLKPDKCSQQITNDLPPELPKNFSYFPNPNRKTSAI